MRLRDYETRAVRDLLKLLPEHRRVVAVGPTGCGKTVIGAAVVQQFKRGARVGWLAHRVELLRQARDHLIAAGISRSDVGILSGVERENVDARVVVASIDMFRNRPVLAALPKIDLWVVDEAHHITAQSYGDVIDVHPDAQMLGLTATPWRLDGEPLGDVFEHLYTIAEAVELVADGYLLNPVIYGIPRESASHLVENAGGGKREYSAAKLERAMKKSPLMADIVKEWQRIAAGKRTIVYACTRSHGRSIARRFKAAGVAAAYLDAETPTAERQELVGQGGKLSKGEVLVVVNVGVLTEGFDCPPVGCIVVARPTKSLTLWRQMCGRGARPSRGKRFIILDHAGNVWRHRFPDEPVEWSLSGRLKLAGEMPHKLCVNADCRTLIPIAARECPECGTEQPLSERKLKEREGELERLRKNEAQRSAAITALRAIAAQRGLGREWLERAVREVA